MSEQEYQGMRPGDLEGKPYARFWEPNMAPLPAEVADAIRAGAQTAELGLALNDAAQLLQPGYLPLENGFTTLGDGQTMVAVRTNMPGCTGAMFEWWMGWHTVEAERYKLWHPRDHVANGMRLTHLAIIYDNVLSCVLDEDGVIRKLKFLGAEDEGDETGDPLTRMDAEFVLLTGTLRHMLTDMKKLLDGYAGG